MDNASKVVKIKFEFTDEPKYLTQPFALKGFTIAHYQASKGWVTKDPELLKLQDNVGWTVAHEIAKTSGTEFQSREILKMQDRYGMSVAHLLAENGSVFCKDDILKTSTTVGWTVAHEQAQKGWVTGEEDILAWETEFGVSVNEMMLFYDSTVCRRDLTNDPAILAKPLGKATVAHMQVALGWTTEDPEILALTGDNQTPAGILQASRGWTTEDPEILKISSITGWTIAHEQAMHGWSAGSPEIGEMVDNNGLTVDAVEEMFYNKYEKSPSMGM